MIQPCSSRAAVIFEHDDTAKARVALQILDARSPRPQHAPQAIHVERVQRPIVNRRLDDHFVSAKTITRFEQPTGPHFRAAFDLQHRVAIRDDTDGPSGDIGRATLAPRENLRTGVSLASFAERARSRRILEAHGFKLEIIAPLERAEIDGDHAAGDWIGPQLSSNQDALSLPCALCLLWLTIRA